MNKWGLTIRAAGITLALLAVKVVVEYLNIDTLSVSTLVTAFIGGAIFTIAIIFAGVLADYKESEKIPAEIATALRTMYSDLALVRVADNGIVPRMRRNVCNLLITINTNFRNNTWDLQLVDRAIGCLAEDISRLVDGNVPPQYTVKLKNELGTIDKLSHRIKTIEATSFIPAAYAISELATAGVVLLLLLVRLEPLFEGIVIFSVISMLMISLLLLIRDMDNPFETGKNSCADVDLFLLWDLEEALVKKEEECRPAFS
ncbi:MAG: hypothetical protein PHD55_04530 [Methanoregula sp.]|nr:hypothetical protein [Methanoregula sp.]